MVFRAPWAEKCYTEIIIAGLDAVHNRPKNRRVPPGFLAFVVPPLGGIIGHRAFKTA
jgi:hypothetical protein